MRKILALIMLLVLFAGCGGQRSELTTVKEILALAKEDKVQGRVRLTVNGMAQAGLNEGVYFGSPGTRLDADLMFRFENVGEAAEVAK
jgi:hypothetical protein